MPFCDEEDAKEETSKRDLIVLLADCFLWEEAQQGDWEMCLKGRTALELQAYAMPR